MISMLTKTDFDTWTGRMVRRFRRGRNTQCLQVLTYHSVSREASVLTDGTTLRHDPAEFERHLDYLVGNYRPVRLSEMVQALETGQALHQAVALTFDDGFADSLRRAQAILYRRRIPMTIFPVTGVIGNTDLMWQHKLAWLVAHGHSRRVMDALIAENFPPQAEEESLADHARRNYRCDLPDILERVLRATGTSGPRLAATLRPYLEPQEMAAADPEFVEFGNHTHTHAILSALSIEEQRREIEAARDHLISLTGRPPLALAYPFGLKHHFTVESKRLARETGHRAALDMRRRMNIGAVDPFELSRKPVPCGSQVEFEKTLEDWPANSELMPSGRV